MKFLLFFLLISAFETKGDKYISLNNEVDCFAAALYFESRSEILAASVGVAELIFTRMKSNYYSNTACDIIKERGYSAKKGEVIYQFEWYENIRNLYIDLTNPEDSRAWHQALVIAESYLSNSPPNFVLVDRATLFHDDSMTPWWAKSPNVKLLAKIGSLMFYEEIRNGVVVSKTDSPITINVKG